MRVVIVEDESLASRRLESMILAADPGIVIEARLESVEESVQWFMTHEHPDLIFLDIHLEDDLSFSIFEKVRVTSPIIFTTAYDEYAIRAFKLRSIDYLLKPIVQDDLNAAIRKYKDWNKEKSSGFDTAELARLLNVQGREYRERFSVAVGEKLKSIHTSEVAYFFSTSGITFVVLNSKNQYSIDLSLDKLAEELDPKLFFRINRQYLIHMKSIATVHVFPKSRLKISLIPPPQEDIFVSLDKVTAFKRWMDGEK
ncbi:MAG: LytTR family DNA-binding domain-containing protein [Bacteroidales bacterium]